MTVTYTADVATATFGCFGKLLFRWTGSIYKLMWKEFAVYFCLYYAMNLTYRFLLNDRQQELFEIFSRYCESRTSLIPIAFVLGFYVSMVVNRWWDIFNGIPWPDRLALYVSANIVDNGERGRLMRRTIMRYINLAQVMTMASISPPVKKRFPSIQHMLEAGFLQGNELQILNDIKTESNKYFIPLSWACALITRARKENRIRDDFALKTLIEEVNAFRGKLGGLFGYDWVTIPLVYTQVVTWAVYMFCFSTILGRQLLIGESMNDGVYIPIFTFLQFFFYMGWLKVAEALINPFGDDDDDFDLNVLIDRNLQVSYLMVDEIHQQHPQLVRDQYWDEVNFDLPYTAAAVQYREEHVHKGSADGMQIPQDQQSFVPLPTIDEGTDSKTSQAESTQKVARDGEQSLKKRYFGPFKRNTSQSIKLGDSSEWSESAINIPPKGSPRDSNLAADDHGGLENDVPFGQLEDGRTVDNLRETIEFGDVILEDDLIYRDLATTSQHDRDWQENPYHREDTETDQRTVKVTRPVADS